MKRLILPLIIAFLAISGVYSTDVNIIMKDGSVFKGNMLGHTSDEVYLEQTNGQSITLKVSEIKSAFDAGTGDQIDLTASVSSESASSENTAENPPVQTNTVTNVIIMEQQEQEPEIVVIPNTYVYYYYYDGYDCFFYGGYWWRPWHGFWYRSGIYNGGWLIVNPAFVPYSVIHLPPRWRVTVYNAPRVGWVDVRMHWQEWYRGHYWASHGWARNAYVRPAVRQYNRPAVIQGHPRQGNVKNENKKD
jgi:hypothetical protein